MRLGRLRHLMLSACLLAAAASAHAETDCLEQTWRGTIGGNAATFEFTQVDEERGLVGRYHYGHRLADLLLVRDGPGRRWKELDPDGGHSGWLVLDCKGEQLMGQWQSPDQRKSLAVQATAVSDDYGQRRLEALAPKVAKRLSLDGHRVEMMSVPDVDVGFPRLVGSGPGVAKINAELLREAKVAAENALDCLFQGRATRGKDHGFEYAHEATVRLWNAAYVVIESGDAGHCGGAHPFHEGSVTTYDARTGEKEAMEAWLQKAYVSDIAITTPLGRLLAREYLGSEPDAQARDCLSDLHFEGGRIAPTAEGLSFRPWVPYAATPCEEDVVLPYKAVRPFLSELGRARAKAFMH